MAFLDTCNRIISYLRVSVTDRCNLRCTYCMPEEGVPWCSHDDILRYEEILKVVQAAAELGINKVRITGGEPLVRRGVVELVRSVAGIAGIEDVAMTTNGTLLPNYARELASAGLQRVNISLDTLHPDRYRQITRQGELEDVFSGIRAAQQAGLEPIKINFVVVRGINDDEVVDMARKTADPGWNVRFIEVMPLENDCSPLAAGDWRDRVVTAEEMQNQIQAELGRLEPANMSAGGGPARYYRLPGTRGTLGFITPISEHFCHLCNRLRLTADGKLRPCLLADREIDLRGPLRRGADVAQIKELLRQAVASKPTEHHLDDFRLPDKRTMSQIGG